MKIVGIICEYNPLHNGHVYHFNKIKKESNADYVILSMSSYLTQRGDLAILDKFTRANLALEMGVDLVLECPSILSMNEALIFAKAHVNILNLAGVNEIWIGSELNDDEIYSRYDDLVSSNEFKEKLKENLKKGLSPKQSYHNAFIDSNELPLMSNDLLGLFYYQAIMDINPSIKLKTIKRTNNFSDDTLNSSNIQSASAVRANIPEAINYVPEYTFKVLNKAFDISLTIPYIRYNSIVNPNLDKLIESTEGIENRIKNITGNTFDNMLNNISSKRYSESKIKRLLMDILFNLKKDELKKALQENDYIRVLGFNEKGKSYLNSIKKDVRIYTNIKDGINTSLDIELRIARVLDMIYHVDLFKQEQKGPIIK